jgi:SepF-like predicted cell division protein (DUF552 family)
MMMVELAQRAKDIIKRGTVKIRVMRSGMYQQLTFTVKRVQHGNILYVELATERQIDMSELSRMADEIGLPVEAPNGKAFPKGTSSVDFVGL